MNETLNGIKLILFLSDSVEDEIFFGGIKFRDCSRESIDLVVEELAPRESSRYNTKESGDGKFFINSKQLLQFTLLILKKMLK